MTTYDSELFVFVVFAMLMLALPLLWAIELWANAQRPAARIRRRISKRERRTERRRKRQAKRSRRIMREARKMRAFER
jgi:biopolymer transport protein ExbB/TolQ